MGFVKPYWELPQKMKQSPVLRDTVGTWKTMDLRVGKTKIWKSILDLIQNKRKILLLLEPVPLLFYAAPDSGPLPLIIVELLLVAKTCELLAPIYFTTNR